MALSSDAAPATTTSTASASRSVSKLALMLAFGAGAAFSWILMQVNENDAADEAQTAMQTSRADTRAR
jgi:hypothetical protein